MTGISKSLPFPLPTLEHTHTIHSDKEEKVDVQKSYDAPCYLRGKKGNHNRFLMASALCPPPPNQSKGSDSSVGDKRSTVLTSDQISHILHSGQEFNLGINLFKGSIP